MDASIAAALASLAVSAALTLAFELHRRARRRIARAQEAEAMREVQATFARARDELGLDRPRNRTLGRWP